MDKYKLSDKEHAEVFEQIKKDFIKPTALTVSSPKAVITGGQPASGKGQLAAYARDEFANYGGSITIDPDRLRSYHPKYEELQATNDKASANHTHYDAKKWSLELLDEAIKHKKNVVIDQTSADYETLKKTVNNLKDKGYEHIELKVMSVPEITSRQGIYHRYEMEKASTGSGRFVPPEVHKEIYDKLANTVKEVEQSKIVDKLTVYDRNYKQIESKEFENERNRPFSDKEKVSHDYKWFTVMENMEYRKTPYTEIENIKQMQREDRAKLEIPTEKNYYGIKAEDHKKLDAMKDAVIKQAPNDNTKRLLENKFTDRAYQLAKEGKLQQFIDKSVQQQVKKAPEAVQPQPKTKSRNNDPDR